MKRSLLCLLLALVLLCTTGCSDWEAADDPLGELSSFYQTENDEPEPEQPVRPKLTVHAAPKLKVRIYTPTTFDEVVNIADDLRDKKAVVVNYERVDVDLQRRICDFVNGSCYVQDGGVKRICNTIVL